MSAYLKSKEFQQAEPPSSEGRAAASAVVQLNPRDDLFVDEYLSSLEQRAIVYLRAGIPVHLRGPSGTGKSTMALQVATRLGRPIAMLSGDHTSTSGDLVGREGGTRTRRVVDRFIHNVQKQEAETSSIWMDSALTDAVVHGYTLFYDEFTRSPPGANNALLMALEERRLVLPGRAGQEKVIEAHPEFRAIFTSNPDDYAGVERPQDALIDRMITLEMGEQQLQTEVGIVVSRTGLAVDDAHQIVALVREVRSLAGGQFASLRAAIMIGAVVESEGLSTEADDPAFVQLCVDVLGLKWRDSQGDQARDDIVSVVLSILRGTERREAS